ncbi:MAG: DDE-type integrase/transposase/recombinase [Candidatus Omnitrophica bacterium]|nr:DDE-type integrase/transposase/recombinase [Candidatus Omnitrophota bacterium]
MTQEQLIVNQRKSLLVYAERNGVTGACKTFGVSRTTFYKIKRQFIATGSLLPKKRRRPRMPNETTLAKKKLLLKFVKEHPTWGTSRYAYEFRKLGISVTQQCLWLRLKRFDLNKRYKRLIYLEKLKEQKQPLTERTLRQVKQQCYKIKEGLWPGHVVALDTFYVGNLKGVGRIYQLSGIDICSRYGWAKLYLSKEQTSAVDFVENTLIPKFFANGVELESILTDNGSEFTSGKFRQLLTDYDINHHRIPKGKPLFNGYCERFQRTIHEEFYQKAFRKRFFKTTAELQSALDKYLVFYNFQRAHFGIVKTGAIPIDVFKSKLAFLRQRFSKIVNLTLVQYSYRR